jgi:type I restriction enzyme, S subunit
MIEWQARTVAELQRDEIILVEDGNHGEYRPLKHEFVSEGVPFLRPPDLVGGSVDFSNTDRINDVAFARVRKGIGAPGDILLSHRATVGRMAKVPDDGPTFVTNPGITFYRVLDRKVLNPDFLYYWMQTAQFMDQVWAVAGGSDTFPYASLTEQRKLNIHFPDITVQHEIGRVLRLLDDKIELNRRMSATLEEMARALYRSWFVDFDPVHARALGQPPAHMDPITAALFPDSFDPDGLPQGWEPGCLDDLIDFNPKERLPKGTQAPYLEMKALPTSGMFADAPYMRDFTSGTKFREHDTLLARITPCLENGKTAVVDDLLGAEIGWGSTEYIVMRAKQGISPALPYCVARDPGFRAEAIQTMTGSSGRQRADAKRIAELNAAIAPASIQVAFNEIVSPMFGRILAAGQESRTLATLRDTLLPRLMSGDLRIREAAQQVEGVV